MVFRPMIFIRGHERPDLVDLGGFSKRPLDPKPAKCLSGEYGQNPGFSIMRKMGWTDCEPLGIRGKGITEPVETKGRKNGDTSGLGYEEVVPVPGEQKMAVIRIVKIGENYGIGHSDYGSVFIPNGVMNFIRMSMTARIMTDNEIKQRKIYALMIAKPGRFTWRLVKVDMIV